MRLSVRALGAVGALALSLTGVLQAQNAPRPRVHGREVVNWDFSPNGAWRGIADQVRSARRPALARGDLQFLNGPSPSAAVTGDYNLPVVLVEFSDTVATGVLTDTSNFRKLVFSATPTADGRPYSLKTYYEQVSRGNITITGNVVGWVHTDKSEAFVGQGCNAIGVLGPCTFSLSSRFGAFLGAALDSVQASVDWSLYDKDGNGIVDFVTFFHPSRGGECGGTGAELNNIWSHRYTLQRLRGSMYQTSTAWPGHPGQFIKINDYIIQGGFDCTAGQFQKVGTLAHETGHAFGIPDLYCAQGCTSGGEGVGEWSLMGSGNYTRPHSPAAWDAWSLVDVGWIHVDSLPTSRTVTLRPIQVSDTALIARISGSDEYFLLENRARLLSDTAQMDPSRPTTGAGGQRKNPGLLVWHIDQSIIDGGRSSNSVNSGDPEGVHLVQADGLEELHAGSDRGDVGDSYPGSTNNRKLTYHSTPASKANDGSVAGFVIDSIQQVSDTGNMVFRFRRSAPFRVTSTGVAAGGQVTVNGVVTPTFDDIFGIGDTIAVSVADTQLVNTGRTQLAFVSWSDAGGRVHNIISDGSPDTVTATLQARYRVNFVANGSGTVGTSGPATNTFVTSGTAVTLTATPNGGATFTNWTGDTTTANATLILPMGKPYSVTANFSGAVAVTYDQATNAILGLAALTGPQATYLDDVGNNNNVYDLGDYLAYLKANGFVLAPEVLRRIGAARPLTRLQER